MEEGLVGRPSFGPALSVAEILAGPALALDYDALAAASLRMIAAYIAFTLTEPHPELGRPGPVCPYAAGGVERNLIQATACLDEDVDEAALSRAILDLRSRFDAPGDGAGAAEENYRAIILAFPRLARDRAAALVERLQKALKPQFVSEGLMIGEFYPRCPAPGLHNPRFRPLQTPFSCLAIRRMTIGDAPFLLGSGALVEAYRRRFGRSGERRLLKFAGPSAEGPPSSGPAWPDGLFSG